MGKVNNKYGLVALSSIFALSMFGCTKVGSAAEMGRYVEEFYDAPEGIYDVRDLRVLSDGTIGMLAYGEKGIELYISDDECQNWNRKEINLPQGDSENSMLSVNNAILSKDGNIFISYYFYDYMKSEEDENLKNPDYYIKDYGTVEGKVLEFGLTAKYGNNFAGGKVRGKFKLIFEFR